MKGYLPALIVLTGCSSGPPPPSGALVHRADLKLETAPPASVLLLGDRELPVQTVTKDVDGVREIFLLSNGQEIESERYRMIGEILFLEHAAGETYLPPMEILKFPLRVGDSWKWKGKLVSGELEHQAEGAIMTAADTLFVPSSSQALKVHVDLTIDVGPSASKRELAFWFIEGRGMVQRAFGKSLRMPKQ